MVAGPSVLLIATHTNEQQNSHGTIRVRTEAELLKPLGQSNQELATDLMPQSSSQSEGGVT